MPAGAPAANPHARLELIPEEHVEAALALESIYVFVQSSMALGVQYFPLTRQLRVDWVPTKGRSHLGATTTM